jgi:FMN phosphatase YigB (HAD superfamily)
MSRRAPPRHLRMPHMPLILLFDLDDTLLDTNLEEFVPAYFQALAQHLSRWVRPELMLPALMSGTQRMLENEDPSLTLQDVFERDFYPRLGVEQQQVRDAVEDFYDNSFSRLRAVTRRREGARELVDWALGEGHRVAIATDPLFPRKAVRERLRWAGLDPERFELICSYESFHFTKSHPAYYAELLGRLGWPDSPVLMVGDDEERDLARAEELGLVTYQVDGATPVTVELGAARKPSRAISHGSLIDLRNWLQFVDPVSLEPSYRSQPSILAILTSTPAVLQGLTSGLSAAGWRHEPTPEDWALAEIVGHLRDTEREVHRAQIEILRGEAQPFVPRPDAAVWAKQRNYLDDDGAQAISDFAVARLQTLHELQGLDAETWRRPARHAIFGPTNFQEVVGFMADHDRLHIQQAWRTLRASN